MRWFGQWPAPIWFSYLLSAIFVAFNFGVSVPRKILLTLLSPLAAFAQWSQGLTERWMVINIWNRLEHGYFSIFLGFALYYVFGALTITLFLLAARVPERPRLNLIIGLIVFATMQNLIAGFGNFMGITAGNYDEFGYMLGQYSLFATAIASLAFRRIAREVPET